MNLGIMIIISLIAGYLASMNIWVANIDHVRLHLNDFYMVGLMTAWMIIMMTIIYKNHYENSNIIIIISLICIVAFYYFIRNQIFINDNQFLNGMIPHHSMAILMSQKIKEKTKNIKIKELADNIIKTQEEEIRIMRQLLKI